jgi:hypothetical protein
MSARTILNPPLINELNGLFNGSTSLLVNSLSVENDVNANGTITSAYLASNNTITANTNIFANGSVTAPYLDGTTSVSSPSFVGGLWGGTVNFSNPLSIAGSGVTGFSFTLPVAPPAGSTLSNIAFSFSPIATTSQSEFVTSYNVAYTTGEAFCTISLYIYQPVSVQSELAGVRYIAYNGTTTTTTLTLLS